MGENARAKLRFNKVSWIRATIIVLGYVVIFGLGFAVGLHYAQNLYLPGKQAGRKRKISAKPESVKGNLTFFYDLKETARERAGRTEIDAPASSTGGVREGKREAESDNAATTEIDNSTASDGYTIQVFSFRSREISERMVAQLRDKGYPAYQSTIDLGSNGIYYRVRIGHFKTRSDAAQVLESVITRENKEAFITRN